MTFTKTQIDRLGNRLKEDRITESDLRLLDDYRRSFGEAYETVIKIIREVLKLEPTGRPAKSTISIREKLRRESIRMTQIQDITGCRVVVRNIKQQEKVIQSLGKVFKEVSIIDRRKKPSYGYRAVHIVVKYLGKLIEIQIRTSLQHLWAELSEKLSDIDDPEIKYGGGDEVVRKALIEASETTSVIESLEVKLDSRKNHPTVSTLKKQLSAAKRGYIKGVARIISDLENS